VANQKKELTFYYKRKKIKNEFSYKSKNKNKFANNWSILFFENKLLIKKKKYL